MIRKMTFIPFTLVALGFLVSGNADAQPAAKAPAADIDLVICLDTSGSMNGLIESAKVKIWDIVNELAKAKPEPKLRISLYTYGSPHYGKESGWVRKNLGFTSDLDMVYQKLFALRTNGGNEYVARVSKAALGQLQWTKKKDALKIIFVCGNESAAQDPMHKLEDIAKEAVKQNVFINTIYCTWRNTNPKEIATWKKLASLAEGRYVSIDQNKAAVVINTPVDKKLQDLGVRLNKTYAWYGEIGKARRANQLAQDKNAIQLGAGVAAARVESKTKNFYRMKEACLVDRCLADPKFDVAKVLEKDLPENLKKMKPEERVKYIDELKQKRLSIQKEIAELSKKRDAYLREHRKQNQSKAERAFDEAIQGVLRTQAKQRGILIPQKK